MHDEWEEKQKAYEKFWAEIFLFCLVVGTLIIMSVAASIVIK